MSLQGWLAAGFAGLVVVLAVVAGAGLLYVLVGGGAAAAGVLGAELRRRHVEACADRVLTEALSQRLGAFPTGYADLARQRSGS